MKREIKLQIFTPAKREPQKKNPEEVMVYGSGAGLYGHLNTLAQAVNARKTAHSPFEIHQ